MAQCQSVAEHWWLKPEVSWVRLPATAGFFTFLCFRLITSKFTSSVRQDALSKTPYHLLQWNAALLYELGQQIHSCQPTTCNHQDS